ncbi:hypothetical protein D3C86_1885110 [compost metagenome]
MCLSDVGDQPMRRLCDAGKQCNLLLVVGTHFNHRHFLLCRIDRQDRERHAYVVVEVPACGVGVIFHRKHLRDQLLGCRFAIGAG